MQLLKFIISEVVSAVVGYGVFLILFKIFHVSPVYANTSGYSVALVLAFVLNKSFVFKRPAINRSTILRFLQPSFLHFLKISWC